MSQVQEFYRKDIDGLRAIAILAVVAYHVGLPGVPGGFVGVDVFFVLSGYLITSLLIAEARRDGTISLPSFYARRIRRLFPALFVVVCVTTVLGFFLLLPIFDQQQSLARSAIATALYVSNFYFWAFSPGYFDQSSDLQPLLHTWSLSVEEQYYLIWPLLVWLLLRHARQRTVRFEPLLMALTLIILAASLGWSIYGTPHHPEATFFLLPARAWELAVGAALALYLPTARYPAHVVGTIFSIAGLLAIGLSVALLSEEMAFPGYLAIAPVAGTALVVAGGQFAPSGVSTRVLSTRPMVLIGLLSYSWYLWHWPLLALTRAYMLEEANLARDLSIGLLSLVLAYASYRLVENPIRFERPGPFRRTETTLAAGIVISLVMCMPAAALGAWAKFIGSQDQRYKELISAANDRPNRGTSCHQASWQFKGLLPRNQCTFGSDSYPIRGVLWGDSHAEHFMPLMEAFSSNHPEYPVLVRSFAACRPTVIPKPSKVPQQARCEAFNSAVRDELTVLKKQGASTVILSAHWEADFGRAIPYSRNRREADRERQRAAETTKSITATVDFVVGLGFRVLLFAPVPTMSHDVPSCLARRSPSECGVGRDEANTARGPVIDALTLIQARHPERVRIFDPIDTICSIERCSPISKNQPIYSDSNHITTKFSRSLAARAETDMRWALAGQEQPISSLR